MPATLPPCAACGKADATQRCARCQASAYCDRACQKQHWKQHKRECVAPLSTDRSATWQPRAGTYTPSVQFDFTCSKLGFAGHPIASLPGDWLNMFGPQVERSYAVLAAVTGQAVTYNDVPAGPQRRRRFNLPAGLAPSGANIPAVVDTQHPRLVNPRNGAPLLDAKQLQSACGPGTVALMLHGAGTDPKLSAKRLAPVVAACPALAMLAVTECPVTAALIAVPNLRALRLGKCHNLTDAVLAAAVAASENTLVVLDVEALDGGTKALPGPKTAAALSKCGKLETMRFGSSSGGSVEFFTNLAQIAVALDPTKPLAGSLKVLHIDSVMSPTLVPTAPAALEAAIAAAPQLQRVDLTMRPGLSRGAADPAFLRRLVQLSVTRDELATLGRSDAAAALTQLHGLHLCAPGKGDPDDSGPLGDAHAAALRAVADTVRHLHVGGTLQPGDLSLAAACLPHLASCHLHSAMEMDVNFYSMYDNDTIDDAPGRYDHELLALATSCPALASLDLSAHDDCAYTVFSERGLATATQKMEKLTDIYMFENGTKWNFKILNRPGLRVHIDRGWVSYREQHAARQREMMAARMAGGDDWGW